MFSPSSSSRSVKAALSSASSEASVVALVFWLNCDRIAYIPISNPIRWAAKLTVTGVTFTTRFKMCMKQHTHVRDPPKPSNNSPSSSTNVLLFEALSAINARSFNLCEYINVFQLGRVTYFALYSVLVQAFRNTSGEVAPRVPF
jgi:hypothetical protein